jgi:hypothetical protein
MSAPTHEMRPPEMRATVTHDGVVTMTPASPHTANAGGWAGSQIVLQSAVGVFDLAIDRSFAGESPIATDLLVSDVFTTDAVELGRRRLVELAERLGYVRVWFDHEVVAIEPQLLGGTWDTTCTRCGIRWSDSSPGFWLHTRAAGCFPMLCAVCSHPLDQPLVDLGQWGDPDRRAIDDDPQMSLATDPRGAR